MNAATIREAVAKIKSEKWMCLENSVFKNTQFSLHENVCDIQINIIRFSVVFMFHWDRNLIISKAFPLELWSFQDGCEEEEVCKERRVGDGGGGQVSILDSHIIEIFLGSLKSFEIF